MICTNRSPNQNCIRRLTPIAAAICSLGLISSAVNAEPQGGVVRAGAATIVQSGSTTRIDQGSERAVIDWRSFGVGAGETVLFRQPSRSSATLNRVTGEQLSIILGRIDANGQVVLINPNGILFGQGAQVNVGSLIASTANISNANFMTGRLRFDEPGRPGAGIINQGSISAADGGLVALVAPHVRNDGMIRARLGTVLLGAGDTFTLDLYGDGLISLAIAPEHGNALLDETGRPIGALVSHTGKIIADGGQVVLITAPGAKAVLDQVINLSGTIQADTVAQQGGRIVLQGRGGTVDVTGTLSAQGAQFGQTGGIIEVLGDAVHLAAGAQLDASGQSGGGTLHVGGAFQGQGTTYRAQTSIVDAGAHLKADAAGVGKGGEVVIWADGHTVYGGEISARGGAGGGDGGRVEVSGKRTLDFLGTVDAGATYGTAGTLLLDPAYLNIGLAEASLINRVLHTGTSTTLAADVDINVNATIDGRGSNAGGNLILSAGNDINVNEFIVTNNGVINLLATSGNINTAYGKGLLAGSAPITMRASGNITTGTMVTTGGLSVTSTGGSVNVTGQIDGATGAVSLIAASDVVVSQSIVNSRSDAPLTITAGRDIVVNAQIDGRDANLASASGSITLTGGRNVELAKSVVTENAALSVTAQSGTVHAPTLTAGTVTLDADGRSVGEGLYAGNAAITVSVRDDLASGVYGTTGALVLRSTAGGVNIDTPIDQTVGETTISGATFVNVNQKIANLKSGHNLNISAGSSLNVDAIVTGETDPLIAGDTATPGGDAILAAGTDLLVHQNLSTFDGMINLTATAGRLGIDSGKEIRAGAGAISVTTASDLSNSGIKTTNASGALNLKSTGGNVSIDEAIPNINGRLRLDAYGAALINANLMTNSQPVSINAGIGGIRSRAEIDSQNADTTMTSIGDVSPSTVRTAAKLSITSSAGSILYGMADNSCFGTYGYLPGTYPQKVFLSAPEGVSFAINYANDIEAISSGGAINLIAVGADRVRLTALSPTLGDITMGSPLSGYDVMLSAGRDINTTIRSGTVFLKAGRDINLGYSVVDSLTMDAGSAVTGVGDINFSNLIWVNRGNLSATAGHDIVATDSTLSNVHITGGYRVNIDGSYSADPEPLHSATFNAGHSIDLRKVETLGDVRISANNGNLKLNAPIGTDYNAPPGCESYQCDVHVLLTSYPRDNNALRYHMVQLPNQGVASLFLSAPEGAIDMAGARTVGSFEAVFGASLASSRQINGSNSYPSATILDTPIGVQDQLWTWSQYYGGIGAPVPPGPLLVDRYPANGILALTPVIPNIPILANNNVPFVQPFGFVGSPAPPGPSHAATETSNGVDTLAPIIPNVPEVLLSGAIGGGVNGEKTVEVASELATSGALEPSVNPGTVLVFGGGRGLAQAADFGRSGVIGSIPDVFLTAQTDENEQLRKFKK